MKGHPPMELKTTYLTLLFTSTDNLGLMSLICDPCQQCIFLTENLPYEGRSACCALPELLPQLPDIVHHTQQKDHETLHKKLKLQQTSNSDAQFPISIESHILMEQAHMPSTISCKKRDSSITSRQQHDCFS